MARRRTPEQRAAMARARAEQRAVRNYLDALRATKRPSARTIGTVRAELDRVDEELQDASPIEELLLRQQHRDLEAELASLGQPVDLQALEAAFIAVAASYSRSRGIEYASWRDVGVDAAVLEAAGIRRPPS